VNAVLRYVNAELRSLDAQAFYVPPTWRNLGVWSGSLACVT